MWLPAAPEQLPMKEPWYTGKLLLTLSGHSAGVNDLALITDRTKLVTAGQDGSVIVWKLHVEQRSPQQLAALMRCRLPYQFNDDLLVPSELADGPCLQGLDH